MSVEALKARPPELATVDRPIVGPRSEPPFDNTRDCRFYYGSGTHEQALSGLLELLEDGNQSFGVMCGEPGLGKTLLRTMLHRRLDPAHFVRVSIETSLLDFDGLLLEIISQVSGERVQAPDLPDRYSRLGRFKTLLSERIVQTGRHLAILVDEAQGLDRSSLEGLRNLSNVSAERRNLISVILIGGNTLRQPLRAMPELTQRIGFDCNLAALSESETRAYVLHRLSVAENTRAIDLDDASWVQLHQASRGVPREINRVMKAALNEAHSCGRLLDAACLGGYLERGSAGCLQAYEEFA
jgi:general secretion pathway protein A